MDMIARHLTRYYVNFMLHCNLPQNVTGSYSYLTRQYPFPVFRYPDHVNFKVRLGMCS